MTVTFRYTRDEMIRFPSHWKACDLGAVQSSHEYDRDLLDTILRKARMIHRTVSEKRHLNLRYIRDAAKHVPEINELIANRDRLDRLSELAGTPVETYPVSVIRSTITFMSADPYDGTIDWHADGVPMTELIPLEISDDAAGGRLQIYQGHYEIGMATLERHGRLADDSILNLPHRRGHSTLAQLIRVLHRTEPLMRGTRVTLNLNLRSVEKPYIDDNTMYYLGADNPDFAWESEYLTDMKTKQLPAYMAQVEGRM